MENAHDANDGNKAMNAAQISSFIGLAIRTNVAIHPASAGSRKTGWTGLASIHAWVNSPGFNPRALSPAAIAIGQNAGTLVSENWDDLTAGFFGMTVSASAMVLFFATRPCRASVLGAIGYL